MLTSLVVIHALLLPANAIPLYNSSAVCCNEVMRGGGGGGENEHRLRKVVFICHTFLMAVVV